ncbi:zf-HC2 domain-containing protein [Conchiformibius steedae DSM 2580]|uniref:Zf-HC2 domain-containing protein n=1 Tax=Conchiformibius steedae DSM 2580 TaxID=1121352 RepID=A0AAE9HYF1_9NEIS|nr:zf-HC2 domain-containing protein [Conchiformibius steedae]QMT33566.1 zf-HC2 domain-containing protein [Conchiformibius steedae]URD68225.1 zf-HC2 domain-containing protein [Conchiformibius steedae DSM 2580]
MLNCKEACKLLSQGQDRELTRGERWQLRLHLPFCPSCRRYHAQLSFIRKQVGQWQRESENNQHEVENRLP